MKYDENDSRHPRYVAKIRETAGVHPDVVGHIRVIMKRLEIIESQIESMGNAQRRMWDLLDDTAELTALLSEDDTFEELSNEEYLLADKICLEIKEYMSQFVDTDEKVVDNLCEIVMHRIVGDSDAID